MKHKMLMIAALCTALAATLAQPARCEWHWETTQITSGHTWFTGAARVFGDKVYWTDRRSGAGDVYVWDQAGGERPLIDGPEDDGGAAVYGDKVVVSRYVNSQQDLYLWDPVAGMQPISTGPGNQYNADIYGTSIVYQNTINGTSQVWMWDPLSGARAISPSTHAQQYPRIWGDSVVWQESRTFGRTDVYMWNPRDGEKKLSTYIYGMDHPDIYGDTVVMSLHWQAGMYDPFGIWQWKAGQGLVGPLVEYQESYNTRIYGDIVTWGGAPGGGLVAYHPSTGMVSLAHNAGGSPDVYGNKVVWVSDTYDVWMAELVPEPSSLLALACGCTGLAWFVRRRRTH